MNAPNPPPRMVVYKPLVTNKRAVNGATGGVQEFVKGADVSKST